MFILQVIQRILRILTTVHEYMVCGLELFLFFRASFSNLGSIGILRHRILHCGEQFRALQDVQQHSSCLPAK